MQVHKPDTGPEKLERTIFNFEYELPGMHGGEPRGEIKNQKTIRDDMTLMHAINMAFQGQDEKSLVIKFIIHEP